MTTIRAVAVGTAGAAETQVRRVATEQPGTAPLARRGLFLGSSPVLTESQERVRALAQLPQDWDGEGAEAVAAAAITAAQAILQRVIAPYRYLDRSLRPYFVVPLADGGIELEWRTDQRSISVDITPEGGVGYLLVDRSGASPQFHEKDESSMEEAVDMVTKIALARYSV